MIITVTLNAALDVTYRVPRIEPHTSHRVSAVSEVAGGKGVNVASVLTQQGVPVLATGLLGGATGELIGADLDARGIRHDFSPCDGESRRALTVVSEAHGDATVFNEPGPVVQPQEWKAFVDHLAGLVERLRARVVVASGSLPPGVPADAYAEVVRVAREGGALSIVDSSADALTAALPARPDLVKPNLEELREVTGEDDAVVGATRLLALGAREVVVSAGADGLVDISVSGGVLRARLAEPLSGNPTGAGDAAVAALAAGLAQGRPARDALAEAVAWSAAAVLHPLAGQARHADIDRLRPLVRVEEVAMDGPSEPSRPRPDPSTPPLDPIPAPDGGHPC